MKDIFSAHEPVLVDCRPGFSFFYDLIRKECNGLSPAPMHRICTVMRKMEAECFVREELESNQEMLDEQNSAAVRTGGTVGLKAVRLTFFRNGAAGGSWRNVSEILGYLVLVGLTLPCGTTKCFILESVIRVPSIWIPDGNGKPTVTSVPNYYVHCCREFDTVVGTKQEHLDFKLVGSFFSQQNGLTNVCAHAALRMGINSSPAFTGQKLTNRMINDFLNIDHSPGKRVGKYGTESQSVGLATDQIVQVIKSIGWQAHVADFNSNPAIDYEDYIYPIIESGCPVILGVHRPGTAHVLAVVGHTLNSDRWTPEARHGYGAFPISPYISTSAWTDHFIVSDDNFGMYVTLPTEAIRNMLVPKFNPNLHASLAIGVVPAGVNITGYFVEQAAASLVTKIIARTSPTSSNRWFELLKETLQKESVQRLVCRTLLYEKARYIEFMKNVEDDQKRKLSATEIGSLQSMMPDRFWVTEVTVPNLYTGNKRKLGDIVTPADATKQQFATGSVKQLCWLPGLLLGGPHATTQGPQGWSLFGHVPLLRAVSQPQSFEW